MQVTCPNPGCGALYTIGPQHVGQRSSCKKCGAVFVIESDRLRLVEAGNPASEPMSVGYSPPAAHRGGASALPDPFSIVLGVGAVLAVLFVMLPVIDKLKVDRIGAKISAEMSEDKPDEKAIKNLQEDRKDAQIAAQGAPYFYAWGMTIAFICLAVGEIGYVATGSSKAKRVVGGILLTAQLLLVFILYNAASVAATMFRGM